MNLIKTCKTPERTASIAALISGVTVHLFGLVNVLHNYDDITQQPGGYGTGITSGRWLLSLLGDCFDAIGGNYNLPLVNGVLFLGLIAIAAGFLISVFQIQSRGFAVLIGALFAVFPSAFSTLVFRYTSAYYGIAILLSVLAAWFLQQKRSGLLLSALCTACSLGIYQAYVPITIGIFVLLLLQQSLDPSVSFRKLICRGLYDCAALLLGLLFYYILLKAALVFYGTELSNYQGVNEMGKLSLTDLPELLHEAVYSFCMLPLKDYCGLADSPILKGIYLLLGVSSCWMLCFLWLKRIRKPLLILFGTLMCLLFPVAVNFIIIMCPESWIYTLMVYSFVLIPCAPVILTERFHALSDRKTTSRPLTKLLSILLSAMCLCYAYQTNINYTALYYSNRQVENYLNSMIVQVRMAEGFDPEMEWAFIGKIEDPLLHSYWRHEMNYGGIEFTQWMLQRYSWPEWIRNYYGYTFPMADEAEVLALSRMEQVDNMPCWPADGSIQVIDGTIVIKCQELQ